MRLVIGGLLIVTVLAAAAGCGDPETVPAESPSQPPGSSPSLPPPSVSAVPPRGPVSVVVHRTGGFAGVDHRLEVKPDGTWSYAGDGNRQAGRLTGSQVDRLRVLADDGRLPAEAKHKDKRTCQDGYGYDVTIDSFTITAVECGRFEERPALNELVRFLKSVTPL
jgi:hypothetical protein